MTKFKKIATAAISTVMAGTMIVSLAACGPKKTDPNGPGGNGATGADSDIVTAARPDHIIKAESTQTKLTPTTDANGLKYASDTKLTLNIGYNSAATGISYNSDNIKTLDGHTLMGVTQSENTLKPAWRTLQQKLGVTFVDQYSGTSAGSNIGTIKSTTTGLAGVTAFTASAATINAEGVTNNTLLDISLYLDYMPNYKAFLEANPVVWASLIANAESGSMYMIPYFDGNDDIEKYVLMRKDLVETLLNGKTGETLSTATFAEQATAKNNATTKPLTPVIGNKASAESFMGTTGHWTVATTNPASLTGTPTVGNDKSEVSNYNTVNVRIDYDKALAAAKDEDAALGKAISAAAGKTYTGESGNIVDLQNFVINETSGAVTGGQLLTILREYIDVAYLNEAGTASFYTEANGLTRASVFNSACATWDADLYTALGRCFVTCGSMLGSQVKGADLLYLIAGRAYTTQRTTDVSSLAGELYGVRGLESRYNYTYISAAGETIDARNKPQTWDALERINKLALEGLFNTAENVDSATGHTISVSTSGINTGIQTLSMHDYVQTQTAAYGFTAYTNGDDYNFAPILTPVSVWNEDGDPATSAAGREDGKEKIMRFTESWRGVKDGGIAVSYDNVKDSPDRLAAVLEMIDYCYSTDGQILMTYGPYSSNGNTNPNGTWYANASSVSPETIADVAVPATNHTMAQYTIKEDYVEQFFIYEGKVYSGTYYNGRQIPILTDENVEIFNTKSAHNFTNHARLLLGTTLPVWNKDQGFEYLCTAPCGLVGSDIVNIALNNETVKHQFQTIDEDTYWYTLVPTQLPYSNAITETLGSAAGLALISGLGADNDNFVVNTSGTKRNLLLDIMYYGFDTSVSISYVTSLDLNLPATAQGVCTMLDTNNMISRLSLLKRNAWYSLLDWYNGTYAN